MALLRASPGRNRLTRREQGEALTKATAVVNGSGRRQTVHRRCTPTGLFFFFAGVFATMSLYSVSISSRIVLPDAKQLMPPVSALAPQSPKLHTINNADPTAHFPRHCLPWPGEDSTVEGGYVGHRLLYSLRKSIEENQKVATQPNILCLWELHADAVPSRTDVASNLLTNCQSVWVLYSGPIPLDLKAMSPSIRLWSAHNPHFFWINLREKVKNIDWLLILPNQAYVIFPMLESQLRSLSPNEPLAVPAGVLSAPNEGKATTHNPDEQCPGHVYSRVAVEGLTELPAKSSIKESLLEALRLNNNDCPLPEDLPFTFVDTSNYTTPDHWRRLDSILNGDCDDYWNTPLGARDENGNWGYIHDPTWLRHHPLTFNTSESYCQTQGRWYDRTRFALNKVEIAPVPSGPKRVFCMVYTHSNSHDQLRAIAETWGPRCDGFMAASNQTDRSIGAVDLWHEGPEIYGNMWQKVRAMWEYVDTNYADQFDFFHIGGDDHFVIPENLRHMVSTGPWHPDRPLYLGGSLAQGPRRRYCGGGSGYTLNKAALDLLMSVWNEPNCFPHWQGPEEDITIAKCFRLVNRLQCMDTNDELQETRYHPWDAAYHGFWNHKQKANWIPRLLENQGIASKDNMGQISKSSVSFHLKQLKPDASLPPDSGMRLYYALLYGKC